jgi:hypothetical protein
MAGGGGGADDNTAQGGHLIASNALTSHHGRLDPNEGGLVGDELNGGVGVSAVRRLTPV